MGRLVIGTIVIPFLGKERTIRIYLPKKYDEDASLHFPVLYMHDAQNIFTNEGAFGGVSWGIKDTMEQLELDGITDGIIVAGIDNEGERRFNDYSPWTNEEIKEHFSNTIEGGDGEAYADFFANTFKPFIDKNYRTLPEASHTAVAGSSMGGLISTFIKVKYPEKFAMLGAFSTASWFSLEKFNSFLANATYPTDQKYFIEVGTAESVGNTIPNISQLFIDCTLDMQRIMLQRGVNVDNIKTVIAAGEAHCEANWSKYMREFITFSFDLTDSKSVRRNVADYAN